MAGIQDPTKIRNIEFHKTPVITGFSSRQARNESERGLLFPVGGCL